MGSAFFLRLIVFLLLAVAAGIVFFSTGEEFDSSPSREAKGLEGVVVRPAASDDGPSASKVPQASASDSAFMRAPAETMPAGGEADHAGRLASAIAAAGRNGSMNQPGARARTGQQAQDMLQKLMEEQARKDSVPLVSPFGENRQRNQAR